LLTLRSTLVHPSSRQLVILGGTPTALAVARDARRLGVSCQVLDIDGGPIRHSNTVDVYNACSSYEEALTALAQLTDSYWLIADSDHWLRFIIENRHLLSHANILHPATSVSENCLTKDRFSRWCGDAGFSTPEIFDPDSDDLRFPVVVRPKLTRHREIDTPKACVARDRGELDNCLQLYRSAQAAFVVTEALIDESTRYFAVGFARRSDGETLAFATEKLRPPVARCGGASYVETRDLPDAIHLAESVAERTDFVGFGELEIACRNGVFSIIELNPRPWLQYGLAHGLGLSLLGFVALEQPQPQPRGKANWINLSTDVYVCLSRTDGLVWHAQLPLSRFLAQALTANCRPLWDWRDPQPFIRNVLAARRR